MHRRWNVAFGSHESVRASRATKFAIHALVEFLNHRLMQRRSSTAQHQQTCAHAAVLPGYPLDR